MKKILIIEDDWSTNEMYDKFLENTFPGCMIRVCTYLKDAENAIKAANGFDLYILDGTVRGGHTYSIIDTLPKEKIVVISGEDSYVKECQDKGIKAYNKPFTWTKLRENVGVFTEILNK